MWLLILSDQLPIVALVGRYLTNQLIGRRPILWRLHPLEHKLCSPVCQTSLCGLVDDFSPVFLTIG